MRGQDPGRGTPVAYRVLFCRVQLCHGPAIIGTSCVGDESRVVPEAAVPPKVLDQPSLAGATKEMLSRIVDQGNRTYVSGRTGPARASSVGQSQFRQYLRQVLAIGRVFPGIPCRIDTGAPVEKVDFQPTLSDMQMKMTSMFAAITWLSLTARVSFRCAPV